MTDIDTAHIERWKHDADKRCGTCADDPDNYLGDRLTFVCLNCRILFLVAEVDRLARWKDEAMPVMDGLQDLGRALDLPLGERTTGPAALAAVESLLADRAADRRELHRLREEVRVARVQAATARRAGGTQ